MLVLTRKLQEEILIGDNIKVTLMRVRGNTVRIGIEAPRDVRIVRGELERLDSDADAEDEQGDGQISDREQAFAHPRISRPKSVRPTSKPVNRLSNTESVTKVVTGTEPKLYSGTVKRNGEAKLSRAPLADFVAAS